MFARAEPEQVVKVAEYHRRLESPRYMYAVRMAQSMLEDYPSIASRGEVSYRDIVRILREMNKEPNVVDVAELVSSILHERGIKIWR